MENEWRGVKPRILRYTGLISERLAAMSEEKDELILEIGGSNFKAQHTIPPSFIIEGLLKLIGEDPTREGLLETPLRVLKSFKEIYAGYTFTEEDVLNTCKSFEDGSCDEMVLLKGIEFQSMCEHHMLPFIGVAHIAYIPNGRVIGVSKMGRILDIYSKRLQIQERLTQQVTSALDKGLQPLGSACVIEAHHQCMSCRGVKKQNSIMVTSSLTGEFKSNPTTRAEFMSLIRG